MHRTLETTELRLHARKHSAREVFLTKNRFIQKGDFFNFYNIVGYTSIFTLNNINGYTEYRNLKWTLGTALGWQPTDASLMDPCPDVHQQQLHLQVKL